MTSRNPTRLLALREERGAFASSHWSDIFYRLAFGFIGWPWLLFSLWGGTKRDKRRLLARIGLAEDALPHLGSWKADTGFLHRIVDAVEELRPRTVVELGAGASTIVCAKALQAHGGGQLFSYDQNEDFVEATSQWIKSEGVFAELRHAPLSAENADWPGRWYDLSAVPKQIDLLIVDGPPWAVHPYVRGAAECLFDRLSAGGIVLLDDAARPGERVVARRWARNWPNFTFERVQGSTKGTLVGRKARRPADIISLPRLQSTRPHVASWRRAAAIALLVGAGWLANDLSADLVTPAHAASFVDEAEASHSASLARHRMASQPESVELDRSEIARMTGLSLPQLPANWQLTDVQVYPSDVGLTVTLFMTTDENQDISLFAARADSPAGELPLIERRRGRSIAYWEEGHFAYAVTGNAGSAYLLDVASQLAVQTGQVSAE